MFSLIYHTPRRKDRAVLMELEPSSTLLQDHQRISEVPSLRSKIFRVLIGDKCDITPVESRNVDSAWLVSHHSHRKAVRMSLVVMSRTQRGVQARGIVT